MPSAGRSPETKKPSFAGLGQDVDFIGAAAGLQFSLETRMNTSFFKLKSQKYRQKYRQKEKCLISTSSGAALLAYDVKTLLFVE
jgi:hypothetical protein